MGEEGASIDRLDIAGVGSPAPPRVCPQKRQSHPPDRPPENTARPGGPLHVDTQVFQTWREGEEAPVKTIHEMIREARARSEEREKLFKFTKHTRYGDAPMEAYARLSRARTHSEVNAAAGYARRRIAQFKTALRQDSDNAVRIRAAIQQLQKAVQRAGKKKRELDRELLLERRRKKVLEEDRRREAQRLCTELKRQRVMRSIRESGYLRETEVENRLQAQLASTRAELQLQAQGLPSAAIPGAGIERYTSVSAPPGPPATAGIDLQV